MNTELRFPFYAKFSFILIGAIAMVYIMFIGQHLLIPLICATIISILLNPVVNFLVANKINRILAISLAVLLAIAVTILFLYFISAQLTLFTETYPQLKEKFNELSIQAIQWFSIQFNIKITSV